MNRDYVAETPMLFTDEDPSDDLLHDHVPGDAHHGLPPDEDGDGHGGDPNDPWAWCGGRLVAFEPKACAICGRPSDEDDVCERCEASLNRYLWPRATRGAR